MTLSCDKTWTAKKSFGPGIFVNETTIADVGDLSGTMLPFMADPVDIGIKLYLDVPGLSFQPELNIVGNFRRDERTGEITGWGGAFVVQDALYRLGYSGELDSDNHMPQNVLASLVGKRFLRLSYISGLKPTGKPRYSDWNNIASVEEGAESLVQRFRKSVARGYPKNYRPDLANSTGENAPQQERAVPSQRTHEAEADTF